MQTRVASRRYAISGSQPRPLSGLKPRQRRKSSSVILHAELPAQLFENVQRREQRLARVYFHLKLRNYRNGPLGRKKRKYLASSFKINRKKWLATRMLDIWLSRRVRMSSWIWKGAGSLKAERANVFHDYAVVGARSAKRRVLLPKVPQTCRHLSRRVLREGFIPARVDGLFEEDLLIFFFFTKRGRMSLFDKTVRNNNISSVSWSFAIVKLVYFRHSLLLLGDMRKRIASFRVLQAMQNRNAEYILEWNLINQEEDLWDIDHLHRCSLMHFKLHKIIDS